VTEAIRAVGPEEKTRQFTKKEMLELGLLILKADQEAQAAAHVASEAEATTEPQE